MKKFFSNRFLIAILILAAFLRLWQLGNVPPSASMDEASIGFNAYSVSKIGTDEYGDFPLISQRSYDDWRRSTYLFLVVPFVALFGLNVIAIRLPAVLLSVLTVWATYHILLSLFPKRSELSSITALLGAFLLAISPWHIYISRLGHESNAYLSFFVFGILFFLRGIKNKWLMILSWVLFTLSMISYYAGQILVPLFGLGLLYIYRDNLKKILIPMGIFVLLLVPIFWEIFSPSALIRFQGTSAFDLSQKKITNAKIFTQNYLSHFKVRWLFTNSSRESFKVPNLGLLYIWELPFIIVGIFVFLSSRQLDKKAKLLVFLWLLLAPFPGSIATQAPHAMRVYAFVLPWQIFGAFGLAYSLNTLKRVETLAIFSFAIIIIWSGVMFYRNYFLVFPNEQSNSFHYALSKAIPYILVSQNNYEKVVFSNKDNLYQSYMLFLYYSHYDPSLYQRQGGTKSGGFSESHAFGKYEFRPIAWGQDEQKKKTLFIGNSLDFPANVNIKEKFRYLDGTVGVIAVTP